jgi:hypothetical protein
VSEARQTWEPVNLAAPEFTQPAEPPAVCGLLYRGARHAASGPPESLKTLAAFILGLEWRRAGLGDFALIDFEMGEHATRRLLEDLGATLEEIESIWYVAPTTPPQLADIEAIVDDDMTLAIIDSAAGAYGVSELDDNKRADAETFSRCWITPLWLRDVTTLVLDHVVKNSDNRGRYAIGSERKLGTVDVALGFEPVLALNRGGLGVVNIVTHKDRPGHLPRPHAATLELRSDPDTHRITWEFKTAGRPDASATGWRPTVLMDRVLAYTSGSHYEPLSRSKLADSVTGKRGYILQAIDHLIADGQLRLQDRTVVPVPKNVPGTFLSDEGNGNVPRSLSLQEERLSGTTFPEADTQEDEGEPSIF